MSNEETRKLRTWIVPKEVQIHTLKQNIALAEFQISQVKENIKGEWFIRQQEKAIKEAPNDLMRNIANLDLEQLNSDIEKGFIGRLEQIKVDELKIQLTLEEQALVDLHKKITMSERNHKVKAEEENKEEKKE